MNQSNETKVKSTLFTSKSVPALSPFHTTSDEFESTTLFLRSGLPSSLIQVNCPPKTDE